jgi:hypothetical protein
MSAAQQRWWRSATAAARYWGEGHLNPPFLPNRDGYVMPAVEAVGFAWVVDVQTVDNPVAVARFVAQWRRWRERGTSPERRRRARPVKLVGFTEAAWVDAHSQVAVWLPRNAGGFGPVAEAARALRHVDFTDVG